MEIVLQDCKTHLFLREGGEWTEDVKGARPFQHSYDAVEFVTTAHLRDMQIVLTFPQRCYDIVVPLAGERPCAHRVSRTYTAPDVQADNPS